MRNVLWVVSFVVFGLAGSTSLRAAAASASSPPEPQVDATRLGAPIYPGSVLDDHYGPSKYKSKDGQTDAHFISRDSFKTVYAFYKQRMPATSAKPYTDPMSGAKFEIGQMSEPDYIAVSVMVDTDENGKADGTQIDIVHFVDQK